MSIQEQAAAELKRINFGDEDTGVMLAILRAFFYQWDSGGAVSCVAPILSRLIAGLPLSPLTGADDEWHQPMPSDPTLQNVRCGSVFKDASGRCYDIDTPGRPTITFPYEVPDRSVRSPAMEVG